MTMANSSREDMENEGNAGLGIHILSEEKRLRKPERRV